jgi:conjugative relaxase-like TrwC/TraI family protein
MIRMIQSSSAKQAKAYFNDSLRRSDYYLDDQELQGCFHGRVAVRLGVDQLPTNAAVFQALCENINPLTGQSLTLRNMANRTVGYDINFHCPKSVSILHALSNDSHVLDAFQASVAETMRDIEKDAQTRVRKQGQDIDRPTCELIWADFIHQTARPVDGLMPDPHLHAHCFVFNATWDEVEREFKAGQFRDIKRDMPYFQARFHKILSDKLIHLGYQIRRTNTSFEIIGIPERVIDLFSKRTDEIVRIAKELGLDDPDKLDALGSRTRAKKQKGLSMSELKAEWRRQIHSLGMAGDSEGEQPIRFALPQTLPDLTPKQCVDHALQLRFERASVVQDRRILETAYRHSLGHVTVNVGQITDTFESDQRLLHMQEGGKTLCTTHEILAEEQRMVGLARRGLGALQPLYQAMPDSSLEGEQQEAVRHVLTTPDRVSIIGGKAGTGKTTLMKEAVRLIEETGQLVTVVAPTAQAARGVLRDEGFSEAETVAQLLASPELQDKLVNGALWVDEAGLLNTHEMTELLTLAIRYNARLILSGDTRQHASVIRGDALRILNTVAGIKSAQVSRIYRQRYLAYRQAVQALSEGNARQAFETLNEIGAIKTIDPANPFASLANDYVSALKRGKTTLAISPTHQDGERVTQAIRDRLREVGRLGRAESTAAQLVNRHMTQAEKSDARHYRMGQVIQFNQNVPGIARGGRYTVVSTDDVAVNIQDDQGNITALPLPMSAKFDVYRLQDIKLAKGDAIRITRNGFDSHKKRLNNGQLLEVIKVQANGAIMLRNTISKVRYTLPNKFGHLAYAHCITSHAAQGKTVDEVFIAQPTSSFAATNLNQLYVSVSRAREHVHIYTDDPDGLLAKASEAGDRLSALELLKRNRANRGAVDHVIRHRKPVADPLRTTLAPTGPNLEPKRGPHAPRP